MKAIVQQRPVFAFQLLQKTGTTIGNQLKNSIYKIFLLGFWEAILWDDIAHTSEAGLHVKSKK